MRSYYKKISCSNLTVSLFSFFNFLPSEYTLHQGLVFLVPMRTLCFSLTAGSLMFYFFPGITKGVCAIAEKPREQKLPHPETAPSPTEECPSSAPPFPTTALGPPIVSELIPQERTPRLTVRGRVLILPLGAVCPWAGACLSWGGHRDDLRGP